MCSVVCLQSRSPLRCRGSVFFLRLHLVRRLSPSVVFLSYLRDEVTLVWVECRLWVLPLNRNEGLVCWSRLYSFGMGSLFGVKCVLRTLLITIEGLPLAIGSCSFTGSHARCFYWRLVFPWLGIIVCLCARLLFSVWLLSALWASFSWHLFLASHSWSLCHCFFILLSFVIFACCVLCLSLPRVFLLTIWVVLRSLCGLLCSLWPYSLVGSRPGGPFSNVLGFSSSCLGVPGGLPRVFFSSPVTFLSSSRGLLRCWGPLYALCFAPFWRLLVALSVFCLRCSIFLLSRFSGFLARPAFVSPCLRSLFLILPPLRLFLPLLCLSVGASWCVSSYSFVVGWASCFIVLCCGCYLFVFLLVFTSCYRFVVLFSSWRGFARVL